MSFKLPPPAWQSLGDICRKWRAKEQDVLKFAADGHLALYAFVKHYTPTFFRLDGRSVAWVPTTPVVVPAEIADRLIHDNYVNVDEWETKDGVRWEYGIGAYTGRQPLHISISDLVVFTDDLQRFESEHADSDQQSDISAIQAATHPESERDKLLRQIGALALAVAEKGGKYTKGGRPNASQIARAVIEILDALPDKNPLGVGDTSLRKSIGDGLKLLNK